MKKIWRGKSDMDQLQWPGWAETIAGNATIRVTIHGRGRGEIQADAVSGNSDKLYSDTRFRLANDMKSNYLKVLWRQCWGSGSLLLRNLVEVREGLDVLY
jgi:hypothetical protein